MASLYSTGPALFYVALPNPQARITKTAVTGATLLAEQRNLVFLGTAEAKPVIEERPGMRPVFNDLLGESVPFDMMSEGKELWIGANLNRFDWSVYAAMAAVPFQTWDAWGTIRNGANGTMLLQEAQNIWVVVSFPFSGKYGFGYVPGYFARGGVFRGPHKHQIGTNPHSIQIVFQCLPIFDANSGAFHVWTPSLPRLPQAI